jgi:fructokinase
MKNDIEYTIVGLGEILWDMLPSGKQLGGAPANFAYHAAALGNHAFTVSAIGRDSLGDEIIQTLDKLNLSTEYIQIDPDHPTGTVDVKLDPFGQPEYTITTNVAWDFIQLPPSLIELAGQLHAVCFGSLAQRAALSRATIQQFLAHTNRNCLRIFDINLRQAFYSLDLITQSLRLANIVKLNETELPVVIDMLDLPTLDPILSSHELIKTFDLKLVCLTRGENGSILITDEETNEHPGYKTIVADAVGAGDAFTAALTHYYLRGATLNDINTTANRIGSYVASQAGATPPVLPELL